MSETAHSVMAVAHSRLSHRRQNKLLEKLWD